MTDTKKTADAAPQTASATRAADDVRGKLEARLQLECTTSSQTVKVIRLWGDFFRANYWASVPNLKLLLESGTPVVANSRFLHAKATATGVEFKDLTRTRV